MPLHSSSTMIILPLLLLLRAPLLTSVAVTQQRALPAQMGKWILFPKQRDNRTGLFVSLHCLQFTQSKPTRAIQSIFRYMFFLSNDLKLDKRHYTIWSLVALEKLLCLWPLNFYFFYYWRIIKYIYTWSNI